MYRLLPLLRVWLRVILMAIMVPMGILGCVADQLYIKGLYNSDIACFHVATILFPFDKDIISSEIEILLKNQIVDEKLIPVFENTLKYDPYSPRLLAMYAQYASAYNQQDKATIALNELTKIAPNSNVVKELTKLGVIKKDLKQ
jgi:hypothetical protein